MTRFFMGAILLVTSLLVVVGTRTADNVVAWVEDPDGAKVAPEGGNGAVALAQSNGTNANLTPLQQAGQPARRQTMYTPPVASDPNFSSPPPAQQPNQTQPPAATTPPPTTPPATTPRPDESIPALW